MLDRFGELLQAVGDRKMAGVVLESITDEDAKQIVLDYIRQKDAEVCEILAGIPTKQDIVDKQTVVWEYKDKTMGVEMKNRWKELYDIQEDENGRPRVINMGRITITSNEDMEWDEETQQYVSKNPKVINMGRMIIYTTEEMLEQDKEAQQRNL